MHLNSITTIHDVILSDYRTAAVFRRYGLDFCIGGESTIKRACNEGGISAGALLADLEAVLNTSATDLEDYRMSTCDADFLVDYIVQRHHRYVRSMFPLILEHALAIARRHGSMAPQWMEIAKICSLVVSDLEEHMVAEEQILFPYIKKLARAARNEEPFPSSAPFGTLRRLIEKLEREHEEGEYWMRRARSISKNYTTTISGCITCHVLLRELEELERDLRIHLHLERDILFPKVLALEAQAQVVM